MIERCERMDIFNVLTMIGGLCLFLFGMNRMERQRCLTVMMEYYRLHLPEFPELKSLDVLKELFA